MRKLATMMLRKELVLCRKLLLESSLGEATEELTCAGQAAQGAGTAELAK